jgi:hypothetical protein
VSHQQKKGTRKQKGATLLNVDYEALSATERYKGERKEKMTVQRWCLEERKGREAREEGTKDHSTAPGLSTLSTPHLPQSVRFLF